MSVDLQTMYKGMKYFSEEHIEKNLNNTDFGLTCV